MCIDNEAVVSVLDIAVLLTMIYYLYFQCIFQGDLKTETGEGKKPWGHFGLALLTLGIYMIYWHFAAGKRLAKMGAKDRSILYLALNLIAFVVSVTTVVLIMGKIVDDVGLIALKVINEVSSLLLFAILMHMQYSANKVLDARVSKGASK